MPPSGIQIERSLPHWSTQSDYFLRYATIRNPDRKIPRHTDQHNPDYFLRHATIRNPDRKIPATLINTIRITYWGIQTERSPPHWSSQNGLLLEVGHHQESRSRDLCRTDHHNPDYFLRYAVIRNPNCEIPATRWSPQSGLLLEVCRHQESKLWDSCHTLITTIRITSWGMPSSGIQTVRFLPHADHHNQDSLSYLVAIYWKIKKLSAT